MAKGGLGSGVNSFIEKLIPAATLAFLGYGIGGVAAEGLGEAAMAGSGVGEGTGAAMATAPESAYVPGTVLETGAGAGAGTGSGMGGLDALDALYASEAYPATTGIGEVGGEIAPMSYPTAAMAPEMAYAEPVVAPAASSPGAITSLGASPYDLMYGEYPAVTAAAPAAAPAESPGMLGSAWNWMGNNPRTTAGLGLLGINLANSFNQANMASGLNEAQQKAYQDYLAATTTGPPDATKSRMYQQGLQNIQTQAGQESSMLGSSLAARGIKGKGTAAPAGDLSEAVRKSKANLSNQIYGTWYPPSAPGPANYSPSGLSTGLGQATQTANYLAPLMYLYNMYGGRA